MKPTRSAKQTDSSRGAHLARGDVGGADHVAADLLQHVGAQRVEQGRLEDGHHLLGRGGEAQGQIALGVARLHQGADDQLAVGLGDPRRAHADRPCNLQDALLRQAGVAERLDAARLVQLGLGQGTFVGVGIRDAEGGRGALQEVEVDA